MNGPEIKFHRRAFDLTRSQLARRLGVSDRELQKIEEGAVPVPAHVAEYLGHLLSLPVSADGR